MTDNDLENIYKAGLPVSHYAGLRAVYDAGYDTGAGISLSTSAGDPSQNQAAPAAIPAADALIQTP